MGIVTEVEGDKWGTMYGTQMPIMVHCCSIKVSVCKNKYKRGLFAKHESTFRNMM